MQLDDRKKDKSQRGKLAFRISFLKSGAFNSTVRHIS